MPRFAGHGGATARVHAEPFALTRFVGRFWTQACLLIHFGRAPRPDRSILPVPPDPAPAVPVARGPTIGCKEGGRGRLIAFFGGPERSYLVVVESFRFLGRAREV
jgi:hypothetical protein